MLIVSRRDDLLELDLPAARADGSSRARAQCARSVCRTRPAWLAEGCNDAAIIELADEAAVRALSPTSPRSQRSTEWPWSPRAATEHDIASRVFVPYLGIDEDPVTGSAHAALVPYWAERLGRTEFTALQASKREPASSIAGWTATASILGGHCHTVIVGQFQL